MHCAIFSIPISDLINDFNINPAIQFRKMLDSEVMKTSCVNGHFGLAARDIQELENAIEGAKRMIDDAVILDASCIV